MRAALGALAAALIVLPVGPALAERADRGKPLNIEADAGRYDEARQIGLFTGNVVITKGTIVLRAAQIEVRQTPDGHQSSIATGTADAPARFRQKREGLDEYLEGEAERIEYDTRADTVRFVNRAVLRRFRGTTLADEAAGQVITFDNSAAVYSVTGGADGGSGRVRATLSPRNGAPGEPAPAPRPAP
jgi:lipopolysaccharide export system protein LptA